jgi:sugar phosphate isomerase/epimerase
MKSCVTISLVEEARGGPFVFWDGLEDGCRRAAELGYDAVEVFPPAPDAIDVQVLKGLLSDHGLQLAAVGTGAGWVKHGLTLTDSSGERRREAIEFVRSIIDVAGPFGASAIIGSMQGRWTQTVDKKTALSYLKEALNVLGDAASSHDVPLIYEPLNRYETNLCNTIRDGVQLVESVGSKNVVLLADLFHMNIEEADLAEAIRQGGSHIGHVHFVDSNRQPAGAAHMNFQPVIAALREIGYSRYLSAEAFPIPDSQTAAEMTIRSFRNLMEPSV